MKYSIVSIVEKNSGVQITFFATHDEIEKSSPEAVDNFVEGMKVILGAVLPHQRTASGGIDFVFSGCKTPENLQIIK